MIVDQARQDYAKWCRICFHVYLLLVCGTLNKHKWCHKCNHKHFTVTASLLLLYTFMILPITRSSGVWSTDNRILSAEAAVIQSHSCTIAPNVSYSDWPRGIHLICINGCLSFDFAGKFFPCVIAKHSAYCQMYLPCANRHQVVLVGTLCCRDVVVFAVEVEILVVAYCILCPPDAFSVASCRRI